MRLNLTTGLNTLQRPVALILALLPVGVLFASYGIVQSIYGITADLHFTNSEVAMTIEGYADFFQDYGIPVLTLSVILAAVNLWCAFAARERELAVP